MSCVSQLRAKYKARLKILRQVVLVWSFKASDSSLKYLAYIWAKKSVKTLEEIFSNLEPPIIYCIILRYNFCNFERSFSSIPKSSKL